MASPSEGDAIRLFVYKIRKSFVRDRGITINDIAYVVDGPEIAGGAPPDGTDKFLEREPTIWIDPTRNDTIPPEYVEALREWRTTQEEHGVQYATSGWLLPDTVIITEEEPNKAYLLPQNVNELFSCGSHGEVVENNVIQWAGIGFRSDCESSRSAKNTIFLVEMIQATGLRRDIGGSGRDDITNILPNGGVYNLLAVAMSKFVNAFDKGTHFCDYDPDGDQYGNEQGSCNYLGLGWSQE